MELNGNLALFEKNEILILDIERKTLPFKTAKDFKIKTCDTWERFVKQINALKNPSGIKDEKLVKEYSDYKIVVIDSFSRLCYLLHKSIVSRGITGFTIWNEFKKNLQWLLLEARVENKILVYLAHDTVQSDAENIDRKVIRVDGQLKGDVEGYFSTILYSYFDRAKQEASERYRFATNTDGIQNAKSPDGMFAERSIPNDLSLVIGSIYNFYGKTITDDFQIDPICIYGKSSTGKSTSIRTLLKQTK